MTVDLGTGDGRAVLAAAAARPDRLAVGVDASDAAMAEASRRAGRKPGHGGLENALFVVAAAEAPPAELEGVADLVTVQFPWGSLLRGLLGADPRVMGGLAGLLAPGGTLRLLVSSTDRDRGAGVAPIQAPTLRGLAVTEARPATWADVAAAHSSWGKRLGAGRQRPAWLVRGRAVTALEGAQRKGDRVGWVTIDPPDNDPGGAVDLPGGGAGPGRADRP